MFSSRYVLLVLLAVNAHAHAFAQLALAEGGEEVAIEEVISAPRVVVAALAHEHVLSFQNEAVRLTRSAPPRYLVLTTRRPSTAA